MSSARPKRQVRQKKAVEAYQCPSEKPTWSCEEKKALLDAIRRHGTEDISVLQPFVPSRTCKEIEWLIKGTRNNRNIYLKAGKRKTISPIDTWANVVCDLVEGEHKDFSGVLGQVMAVISEFEHSGIGPGDDKQSRAGPDFSNVYQYIESLLLNKPTVQLSPLESAIILDLMYGLATKLRESELTNVKALMMWKLELLTKPVIPGQKIETTENLRKALENDFNSVGTVRQKESMYTLAGPSGSGSSPRTATSSPEMSEEEQVKPNEESSPRGLVDGVGTQTEEDMDSDTAAQIISTPAEGVGTQTDGLESDDEDENRNSPGVGVQGRTTQCGGQVKGNAVQGSTAESDKQVKGRSLQEKKASKGLGKRKRSAESKESALRIKRETASHNNKPVTVTEYLLVDKQLIPLSKTTSPSKEGNVEDENQENSKRKKVFVREFKKPTLYTLNPLCIPVTLLSIKPKTKKVKKEAIVDTSPTPT